MSFLALRELSAQLGNVSIQTLHFIFPAGRLYRQKGADNCGEAAANDSRDTSD